MRTPPRILVVDDTPANVHILQLRLAAHGYEVLTAADGEAALTAARESQPDLILLDVMMPKVDGLEVCRRLRADPSFPFTPIIMVTAKADPKDVVAGLEAGRRRVPDEARRPGCAGRQGQVDAAHQGAPRLGGGDGRGSCAEWNRTLEQRVEAQVASSTGSRA